MRRVCEVHGGSRLAVRFCGWAPAYILAARMGGGRIYPVFDIGDVIMLIGWLSLVKRNFRYLNLMVRFGILRSGISIGRDSANAWAMSSKAGNEVWT